MVAEVVDGELYTSPRPAAAHATAASTLGMDIGSPFQRCHGGPGGWWILDEPELHLGDHILVPDLAGWRRQRMPEVPNVPYFTLPPDWVCEVLSPATRRLDRVRKLPIYGTHKVKHVWLVDPDSRTLEIFRPEAGRWVVAGTHGGDERVAAEPFEAVTLELGDLWVGSDDAQAE